MWENIAGAKRYSRPRGFNIAGASASAVPTPLIGRRGIARSLCTTCRLAVPLPEWRRVVRLHAVVSRSLSAQRGRAVRNIYKINTVTGH